MMCKSAICKSVICKSIRAGFLLVLAACLFVGPADAQDWPSKQPIKVIVPLTAGSGTDVTARLATEQMSKTLNQAFVVENRPGAATVIGNVAVAKSSGDGYTLLVAPSALTITPALQNLPYDTSKDLKPIIPLGNVANVLVSTGGKYKSLKDLIAAARKTPNSVSYVSIGLGSSAQLTAELLGLKTGFKALAVPFKGSPEGLQEVVAGRVDFYFCPLLPALSLIREGKLDALAVSGSTRSSLLPNVPTIAELGVPEATYDFWIGLFAPGDTPDDIADKLHAEAKAALNLPELKQRFIKMGQDPMPMSRQEFSNYIRKDLTRNAELVKAAKIVPSQN
jgi:tripartite-type tricarboxylate transporter receptor subunit TctC